MKKSCNGSPYSTQWIRKRNWPCLRIIYTVFQFPRCSVVPLTRFSGYMPEWCDSKRALADSMRCLLMCIISDFGEWNSRSNSHVYVLLAVYNNEGVWRIIVDLSKLNIFVCDNVQSELVLFLGSIWYTENRATIMLLVLNVLHSWSSCVAHDSHCTDGLTKRVHCLV